MQALAPAPNNYICFPGINEATIPYIIAPIIADTQFIEYPTTKNCVTYKIIAATTNPVIPLPNGPTLTPKTRFTK